MDFLYEYGLFFAKSATIVIAIGIIVGLIAGAAVKQKPGKGQLEIKSINDQFDDLVDYANSMILDKDELKALAKKKKKELKKKTSEAKKKSDTSDEKANLFVINFKGSMDAHEVELLREEVSAVLCVANQKDEVLINIESGGGVVHGYGLGASQLQRIKDKGIPLTACVDKVAASGGYMMACVANKVIAAPFAIIGSIGVIAQIPNFHRLLQKNYVDFEMHTAGNFKRTLTMFGENTDEGREKFKEELVEVHHLFKDHVSAHRNEVDIEHVATGETWFGQKAKVIGLIDDISTSDDYLFSHHETKNIYLVKYTLKKNVAEKLGIAAATILEKTVVKAWSTASSWAK